MVSFVNRHCYVIHRARFVQMSCWNQSASDVVSVMGLRILHRRDAQLWHQGGRHIAQKNMCPRPPHKTMRTNVGTESVRSVLGGAANSGHRNLHVIATALKDLPHAN